MGLFGKIRDGLKKTRDSVSAMVGGVIKSFDKIDEDFYEELEETLILCDIGVSATGRIMEKLRQRVKDEKISEPSDIKELLISIITQMLSFDEKPLSILLLCS